MDPGAIGPVPTQVRSARREAVRGTVGLDAWAVDQAMRRGKANLARLCTVFHVRNHGVLSRIRRAVAVWRGNTFASLRESRNYRLYVYGQLVSLTGTWMQDAALPWLVLVQTDSAVDVGVLTFCRFFPILAVGLYGGVLADRLDNRRLLIAAQTASMVIATVLTAMTFVGWTPLWAIFLLATLGGTALAVEGPNRHALTYQLVGREALPNAVSLNAGIFNAARAVGPAAGGVVIATAGIAWCFAVNALSFLAILVALLLMRPSELVRVERSDRSQGVRAALGEAFAFIRRSPPALIVIAVTLVNSVAGFSFRVLVPVLADQTLHADAATFGVIYAAFGIGALGGALAAASIGRASWRSYLLGSTALNGAVLAIAPLRSDIADMLLLAVAGAGFSVWMISGQSILQLASPDRLRGRVLSVYLMVFGGLQPIGALVAGLLADLGGTTVAYAVAGSVGMAATVIALLRVREMPPLHSTVTTT